MKKFLEKIVIFIGIGQSQILPEYHTIDVPVKEVYKERRKYHPKMRINNVTWGKKTIYKGKRNV